MCKSVRTTSQHSGRRGALIQTLCLFNSNIDDDLAYRLMDIDTDSLEDLLYLNINGGRLAYLLGIVSNLSTLRRAHNEYIQSINAEPNRVYLFEDELHIVIQPHVYPVCEISMSRYIRKIEKCKNGTVFGFCYTGDSDYQYYQRAQIISAFRKYVPSQKLYYSHILIGVMMFGYDVKEENHVTVTLYDYFCFLTILHYESNNLDIGYRTQIVTMLFGHTTRPPESIWTWDMFHAIIGYDFSQF